MRKLFILSTGRTGTKFFATLLNKDPKVIIHHEPYKYDKQILFYAYSKNFNKITDDLLRNRFGELIPTSDSIELYGEVNPYLRYSVNWLNENLPKSEIFHLIRDGRDYIRSAYTRKVFTKDDLQQTIVPKDDDPYSKVWHNFSRFQKLCWYWQHTNQYLLNRVDRLIKFENVLNDYNYLYNNILKINNLNISKNLWREYVDNPINTSKSKFKYLIIKKLVNKILFRVKYKIPRDSLPDYKNWTHSQKEQFEEICGEIMLKCGYSYD